jgi:hypothetical protein
MPKIELTDSEAAAINRLRLSPADRMALDLANAEKSRQEHLSKMTPEARAAVEKAAADRAAEKARLDSLPEAERKAELLLKRKARLEEEAAQIDADLAKPEIASAVSFMLSRPVKE